MAALYYSTVWTDSGRLSGCDHRHLTVIAAVVCGQGACAGAYVIAVQDGTVRELNNREEEEFQLAMYGMGVDRGRLRAPTAVSLSKPILN
jgi:hypothetical protein